MVYVVLVTSLNAGVHRACSVFKKKWLHSRRYFNIGICNFVLNRTIYVRVIWSILLFDINSSLLIVLALAYEQVVALECEGPWLQTVMLVYCLYV